MCCIGNSSWWPGLDLRFQEIPASPHNGMEWIDPQRTDQLVHQDWLISGHRGAKVRWTPASGAAQLGKEFPEILDVLCSAITSRELAGATPGWNYAVRLYEPREEILDGKWTFPKVLPAS
jgi:hypothetical protein